MSNKSEILKKIIADHQKYEKCFFNEKLACCSHMKDIRKKEEDDNDEFRDLRSPFAHDTDRIIHSHSFARYMDKTQVFFQINNDHIARRSLHVQMVSRIARTIGRCLRLNEDLIEAIAVGHDIGHTPFGHAGEAELARILQEREVGTFVHNAQSVRVLQKLEKRGAGLNLTLPVLDGIIGHNGEIEAQKCEYYSKELNWTALEEKLKLCLEKKDYNKKVFPSTLEGCVVRMSDIISYLGKDIDDAITLHLITPEDIPLSITNVLGCTNRDIIRNLCDDVILNSYNQEYVSFSSEVYEAYRALKKFNYEHIYNCDLLQKQKEKFSKMIAALFDIYMDDIEKNRTSQDIFKHFINHHQENYWSVEKPERMVADYLSGMTDQYFLKQYELRFIPQVIDYNAIDNISFLKWGI